MDIPWHPLTILMALHAATLAIIGLRVVMARPVPGVALAWLFLVALLPGIGLLCYLGIGERRLGGRRARPLAELRLPYVRRLREILQRRSTRVDWILVDAVGRQVAAQRASRPAVRRRGQDRHGHADRYRGRRHDLRNHRKIVVVGGAVALVQEQQAPGVPSSNLRSRYGLPTRRRPEAVFCLPNLDHYSPTWRSRPSPCR
jgi:hypothetical protein